MLLKALSSVVGLDWPQWRGPQGDGVSRETNWTVNWPGGEPVIAWQANVGTGMASVITVGGRAFALGNRTNTDTVVAFDAATGSTAWSFSYPSPSVNYTNNISPHGPASTPVVAGGRLYTISREGLLHCLEAGTGQVHWHRDLLQDLRGRRPKYGYAISPLVREGMVFLDVGGTNASTVALDARTGEVRWEAEGGQAGYAAPVWLEHEGNRAVALFKGEAVIAHDPATGRELWRVPWRGSEHCNTATPVTVGGELVVSGVKRQQSEDGDGTTLFAWSRPESVRRWHNKELAMMFTSPVIFGDLVLGFHDARRPLKTLVAIDRRTGTTRWTSDQIENGGFVLAGDRLVVLTQSGQVVIARVSETGCTVLHQAQVLGGKSYAAPTLADGRLYCRNNAGELVCLKL